MSTVSCTATHQQTITVTACRFEDDARQNLSVVRRTRYALRALTCTALTVKGGPDLPEEGMTQGLLGRDALLRIVHQQLLQQILPFWTQVRNQLCDA